MKVLVLAPRLDVPFKNFGAVPSQRGPIEPIRIHWQNMIRKIKDHHQKLGDFVLEIEMPLWQFSPEETDNIISSNKIDLVYVPHREEHSFPIKNCSVLYYMQTVFPWRFYVDPKGFAGGSTLHKMDISNGDMYGPWFDALRAYALKGESKFNQPKLNPLQRFEKPFVLFTCQIPHDQTILYHSKVGVATALNETLKATKNLGKRLIVKGHPVNPGSMGELETLTRNFDHATWVTDINIHELLRDAESVVTVNSGTGMEAMLHQCPIVTFGRAEYDMCSFNAQIDKREEFEDFLNKPIARVDLYRKFFDVWCNKTWDTKEN